MPTIRPVSDLRNHFAEITKEVQSSKEKTRGRFFCLSPQEQRGRNANCVPTSLFISHFYSRILKGGGRSL